MDNEEKKERRRFERIPFREDILINGASISTMDISEGGLYISGLLCYNPDSVIDLTIPFKGKNLTFKAQVRYCHSGIGMGVNFIDLDDTQKAHVKEIIEHITGRPHESNSKGKSILLVEDNDASRKAIKNALCKEGLNVIEAVDGIEAMKFIAEEQLDLIILDLYMKGIDGFKVLSVLKANPKWKELPVMICSGHDTQDVKEKIMNAGADEFFSKRGTSAAQLVQTAKALLQRRH